MKCMQLKQNMKKVKWSDIIVYMAVYILYQYSPNYCSTCKLRLSSQILCLFSGVQGFLPWLPLPLHGPGSRKWGLGGHLCWWRSTYKPGKRDAGKGLLFLSSVFFPLQLLFLTLSLCRLLSLSLSLFGSYSACPISYKLLLIIKSRKLNQRTSILFSNTVHPKMIATSNRRSARAMFNGKMFCFFRNRRWHAKLSKVVDVKTIPNAAAVAMI